MRWCASVLKIFLSRVIENIIDTRKSLGAIREILRDPSLKEGEAWRTDLPALRAQMKEMSALVEEIVQAIQETRKMAQGGAPAPSEENRNHEEANGAREKSQEEIEAAAAQTHLNDLAAAVARGDKIDVSAEIEKKPPIPSAVIPLKRNPAEKV